MLFLHATFEHNQKLLFRTYPFHFGLYMLLGGIFLTLFATMAHFFGIEPGAFLTAVGNLVQVLSFVGFLGVIIGAGSLLHRRMTQEDLRKYSGREHYLNLIAFIVLGALGIFSWLANPSFFEMGRDFIISMLTFRFAAIDSGMFQLYLLWGFILAAYVPITHMGHFFMKYFLYHDIRWSDQPTQDSPARQEKIGEVLNYHVSWSAPHIKGDGKKTWAEVATTNPTANTEMK